MRIGVPKEIKVREYRVGLVPANVRELCARGHELYVESGAGAGIGASDADYQAVGASIGLLLRFTADMIALGPPFISTVDELQAMSDGLRRAIRHVMAQH
jgi:alanine dehydrogenase